MNETSRTRRSNAGSRASRSPKQTSPDSTGNVGRFRSAQVASRRGAFDALVHLFGDPCDCRSCRPFRYGARRDGGNR